MNDNEERWQEVVHVNCPYCGEIMQVACPAINSKVLAVETYRDYFEHDDATFRTITICPKTQKNFFVNWFTEQDSAEDNSYRSRRDRY